MVSKTISRGSNPCLSANMKKKINLTEEQASELYYNINTYYLSLRMAEITDKFYFDKLKFWTPTMNNHLRKARLSIEELMVEFNRQFKAVDSDIVDYDAPTELLEIMQILSRKSPQELEKIKQII